MTLHFIKDDVNSFVMYANTKSTCETAVACNADADHHASDVLEVYGSDRRIVL